MLKDKMIWSLFGGSILTIILGVITISLGLSLNTGPLIVRFDNYHNQVSLTGGLSVLGIVLGMMLLVFAVNLFLSHQAYKKDKVIAYIIGLGNLIISGFFLVATVAITLIN